MNRCVSPCSSSDPQIPILRSAIRLQARASGVNVAERNGQLALAKGSRRMLLPAGQYLMVPYAVHMWDQLFETVIAESQDDSTVLDFSKPGLHRYSKDGVSLWAPGMVEEDSMDAYTAAHTPKLGDVIWDVGAHGGFTSYYFSKLVGPSGKVYAFEPDEHTYPYLLRNIEMHRLDNVIPVKKAPRRDRPAPRCLAWTEASAPVSPATPIRPTSERPVK